MKRFRDITQAEQVNNEDIILIGQEEGIRRTTVEDILNKKESEGITEEEIEAIKNSVWRLGGGILLPNGTNIDEISVIGNYYCYSTANSKTITGTPRESEYNTAFTLKVENIIGREYEYYKRQILRYYDNYKIYERKKTNTTQYSSWELVSDNLNAFKAKDSEKLDGKTLTEIKNEIAENNQGGGITEISTIYDNQLQLKRGYYVHVAKSIPSSSDEYVHIARITADTTKTIDANNFLRLEVQSSKYYLEKYVISFNASGAISLFAGDSSGAIYGYDSMSRLVYNKVSDGVYDLYYIKIGNYGYDVQINDIKMSDNIIDVLTITFYDELKSKTTITGTVSNSDLSVNYLNNYDFKANNAVYDEYNTGISSKLGYARIMNSAIMYNNSRLMKGKLTFTVNETFQKDKEFVFEFPNDVIIVSFTGRAYSSYPSYWLSVGTKGNNKMSVYTTSVLNSGSSVSVEFLAEVIGGSGIYKYF